MDAPSQPMPARAAESSGAALVAARTVAAAFALSLKRLVRSQLFLATICLAVFPILITILAVFSNAFREFHEEFKTPVQVHLAYEYYLRIFFLHFAVFFIANILGFAVVRQEKDDQTLHYILLQPVPRWVPTLGKLFAYLTLSSAVCIASLWLTYLLLMAPQGASGIVRDLFAAGRFVILVKESLVLVLGLLVYGAIAMLMATLFKSGFYALFLLGWESALPYLPSAAKYWTIMHYLQSLLPERLTEQRKLFELLGEPAATWLCLAVIGGVSVVFIALCFVISSFQECLYGEP